jgi:putative endopeptidase
MQRSLIPVVPIGAAIAACAGAPAPNPGPVPAAAASAPGIAAPGPVRPRREQVSVSLRDVGLDPDAIDKNADPCQDFYRYACGNWIQKTEIPGDKSRWSRSFSVIDDRNEAELKDILERAGGNPLEDRLSRFFGACMDEATIEQQGIKPIKPLLDKARRVTPGKALGALLIELHKQKIWALFDVSAEQDFKDATRYLTYLDQNGLGLPDRDYYLKQDEKSKEIREKYLAHVERMLALVGLGAEKAKAAAADVMEIESELAKASKTRVERRDPRGLYNKLTRAELAALSPNLDWDAYFKGLGLADIRDLNVTSKPYFEALAKTLESVPASKWQSYFQWHVVHSTAKLLGKRFVDEDFELERVLTGQKELRARWKRCIDLTDEGLGEDLAQPFVKRRFSGESKAAAEKLIHAISDAFSRNLDGVGWMDEPTREAARGKLRAMAYLVGYPTKWKNYDFAVDKKQHAANVLRARGFDLATKLARIGKPVDRGEWEMTPPTVNAYYNPLKNQMVFPAGILQPPFYAVTSSIPVNLGAMGMVVGHELTHGFDDEGSQFDKDGNLRAWWLDAVRSRFEAQTRCVADRYGTFESLPGVKLDGKLTLGENIADMGGVKLAFYAYRELTKDEKEQVADGFGEDQQFFLSLGQVWCSKERDEWARMAAQIDPHSPPRFRVNGPLSQLPEFAEAFACKTGTPMNPAKKCAVW